VNAELILEQLTLASAHPKLKTQNLNLLSLNLEDLHGHSLRNLINYPRRIPIRQADATVAP
jgi:hypothetical protein